MKRFRAIKTELNENRMQSVCNKSEENICKRFSFLDSEKE